MHPVAQQMLSAVPETEKVLLQMGLVMEDRSRLEHLMGIAQNLRIKGGKVESPQVASREAQPFDKPARLPLQSDAKAINGVGMGGGILGALKLSNSSSQEGNVLPEAGSIIPTYECSPQLPLFYLSSLQ